MDTSTSFSTSTETSCGAVLQRFADLIDAQDWDGLGALLAPGFTGRWVHTGETFDGPHFVALNRHYPGSWRFQVEQVVDAGPTAVLMGRVTDETDTYYVATFARSRQGLLTDLTEVWTDAVMVPPVRAGA
jgi:hypothetical protein